MAIDGALKSIHAAFYSTLHGDSTLLAMVSGIYNDAPEAVVYPYVQIGSATSDPWHTFGGTAVGRGFDTTITVHIWSRYQGDLEALNIFDRVMALLDFATVTVSGYGTAIVELDQAKALVTTVDKVETRHLPAVFQVRVHQ